MKARIPGVVAFFLASFVFAQSIPLRTEYQDTASKVIRRHDGSFAGICVELMDLLESRTAYRFKRPDSFMPLRRIVDALRMGETDVYFALLKNPERERACVFVEPLYSVRYVIVSRAGEGGDIASIAQLKAASAGAPVLTLSGSTIRDFLVENGIECDDGAGTVIQNFDKLLANRGQFLVYQDLAVEHEIRKGRYEGRLRVHPATLAEEPLWLVCSKRVDGAIVADLRDSVRRLKASGEWGAVVGRYRAR